MLHNYLRYCIVAWLGVLGLAASEHHGQVKFGGLPVPGATVTAIQSEKKFTAISGEQGSYSFANLPDGVWTIQVEMLCFAPIKQEVTVAPDAPASEWDLKLLPFEEIKAAAGPVAPAPSPVSAAQPVASIQNPKSKIRAPALPPKKAQTGFQRTDLNATPSNPSSDTGKSADEFTSALPGDFNKSAADVFSINGSVNNGAASPFAQSQAFGNNRRGGRSLYNASLGVFLDNSFLDARSFSLTGQDTPKPAYNHLQGVAAFGGPLRIPHLLRGNSVNFFVGYQLMRNRNASTQSSLMPTLAERSGDLSQARTILDPSNGLPFPGNVIPQSRISPQAKALLNYYPLPNFDPGARYNYQVPLVGVSDQDSVQSRLSKALNLKNQLFGTFNYQRTATTNPNVFAFRDATDISGINTSINLFHRFNQRLFSTVKYEFSRLTTRVTPNFANRENVSGEAGISGNNQDPLNWGPPSLAFSSGIAGLSDAQQSFTRNQTSALSNDSFWNHAGHNLKFGGDFRRLQFNHLSQQDPRGAFTFTGAATGSDFAGFLLGIPDTSSIAFGNADKYFRASSYDAYLTDDWRISPALTLNAGMRWEYGSPITELYGRLVNLDIAPGFAAVVPVVSGNPTGALTGQRYPDSLVHPDKHGFEPRIGLAWRPFLASSTVIRAGYAVNYDTSVYQSIANQMAQQSPLSKSLSVQNSPANPLTLANGFIASAAITPNTFAIDPNFRVGYAQTWQASIQRDLPAGLIMMATYLGIKGTRARQEFLPYTFPAGAPIPCPACPTGYAYLTSNGNSTRESGQFQLRRRLRSGFTATLQYTLSKAIDDAALGGRGQGGSVIAQNWLDLSAERGLSSFDQRHLLNFQIQYSTGVGIGGGTLLGGWRGALLKDWTFTTQITAGSGLPLTPIYFAAVRGTGVTGSIRPEYTGASVYAAAPGFFLNPAAYQPPPAGQWGNAGRDSITGPSQFALDASMGRAFPFRDHGNIDLRFDSTNALNHVVYPSWNTTVSSAQFGLPNSANAMRTLRASLRVRF
jgi:trimeric autotransporter adhesin